MLPCSKKFWAVFLTISAWIISTTFSVVPFLVLILIADERTESLKRRRVLLFYKVFLGTHIFESVIVFFVLYGVVMHKKYGKERILIAVCIVNDMMLFTVIFISAGEGIPPRPLLIPYVVVDFMLAAAGLYYKKTLGEAF